MGGILLETIMKRIYHRLFPITLWWKEYNPQIAIADLIAGITLGLTLIPQSIAYASLAGLGPEYGLYSSLVGGLVYLIFGTIPELNIAPTAFLSLLTFTYTHNSKNNVEAAVLLCFLSGIIELLCGIFHLGFLIDFVSTPVVGGFTSAGALVIASSQIKNLLGLKFHAENFLQVWIKIFQHINEFKKWDTILGLCCCFILLSMKKLKNYGSGPSIIRSDDMEHQRPKTYKTIIWLISIARNAFVVIICAILAYIFNLYDLTPFKLTGKVPSGLPKINSPFIINNITKNIEILNELNSGILLVPFVAILANIGIGKAFSNGKVIDASQEMLAIGFINIFGSFIGSYPVNASFSRSAVGSSSGVKTPLAGLYTASMVFFSLTFLTPYLSFIPNATLAAVIICAVIFMVEITLTRIIWRINKKELVTFFITFIACLFLDIAYGILIGVAIDIIFLLYTIARPKVIIETIMIDDIKLIKIDPTSSILFPSVEYVREEIMKKFKIFNENYYLILIDCDKINKIDFTAAQCFNTFVKDLKNKGKQIVFYRPKKSVKEIIEKACDGVIIVEEEYDLNNILKDINNESKVAIISTIIENELLTKL